MRGYVWLWGVRGYVWVCPVLCRCAWACASVQGCVWDEFSEYLLET